MNSEQENSNSARIYEMINKIKSNFQSYIKDDEKELLNTLIKFRISEFVISIINDNDISDNEFLIRSVTKIVEDIKLFRYETKRQTKIKEDMERQEKLTKLYQKLIRYDYTGSLPFNNQITSNKHIYLTKRLTDLLQNVIKDQNDSITKGYIDHIVTKYILCDPSKLPFESENEFIIEAARRIMIKLKKYRNELNIIDANNEINMTNITNTTNINNNPITILKLE